ncbi:PIR protein [Plasmodium yoelii]|uniref:PIR protein n=3 Tax=Plasmodium yoelii TaxID=5861 RepID=A0AAE9WJK8_PLAYO|nr:PIR protein [Plasmodium yoelii]XP_034493367.1 PIR protein [Plasmodium yoelii]WBY55143.1 PIR protein [Plasmodium yoelii yoelii]WBY58348.1 PIR protein [Plasmodium yoelii yoelii]VTZ72747.1 PIR protein [Plasmodium yoelii]VTZ79264.1 PIR protein [Plasmodium yoelii]|eukprot:XP_022811063.1 PIR protein [Plasmodium yoelii]
MNKEVCKRFKNIWDAFPEELDSSGNYQFNNFELLNNDCNRDNISNNYCNINNINSSDSCNNNNNNNFLSDFNKISAGCLYLLDEFIKDCGVDPSPAKNNINFVDYILIWLRYMLNLKNSYEYNIFCFYGTYIFYCDKYNTKKSELTGYKSYTDIIDDKWYLFNIRKNNISNLYKAFKSLCEMYNKLDDENNDCNKYLEDNEFLKKFEELKNDSEFTEDTYNSKLLSILSNDYDNFKKECKNAQDSKSPAHTEMNTPQSGIESTEETVETGKIGVTGHISEVTSSSSIVSKLIPVVSIFAAISIFLGISYKYSLFGFRKRSQKHLRKKIKK